MVVGLDVRWCFYPTPFVLNSPVSYQLLHSLKFMHIVSCEKDNTLKSSHDQQKPVPCPTRNDHVDIAHTSNHSGTFVNIVVSPMQKLFHSIALLWKIP